MVMMLGLVMLSACTERIDIELEEGYIKLAVEGYLTPDDSLCYVRLTETGNYFSNEPVSVVSNAVIKVDDGTDTVLLHEDFDKAGMYLFPEGFNGRPEQNYTLDVQLPEAIGGYTEYRANAYMPAMTFHIDSIALELNTSFDFWMLTLYAPNPPGRNFYMLQQLTNDSLVTAKISEVNVFDDEYLNDEYFYGLAVMGIDKEDIQPGDKVTLVVSLISEDYYNFILEAQTEMQPHDPMFSGPPANVRSNVDNGAVGYFAAFASTSASTYLKAK